MIDAIEDGSDKKRKKKQKWRRKPTPETNQRNLLNQFDQSDVPGSSSNAGQEGTFKILQRLIDEDDVE